MRLWLPPAPSSTVHTHSNEDIQQPTASLHTARQQPGNSSAPTTPCFGSHATRSLFFSTKARRFAHVWRVHALRCGRRATLQLSDTSQRSPQFAQILPSQLVPNLHSRFTPLSFVLLPGQSGYQRHLLAGSPDDGQPITIASRLAAAKSYTTPVSRTCCRIHIRKLHPSRHIGSRFGGFFCLSHQR